MSGFITRSQKVIDWCGLRALIAITALTIPFIIFQPFLWRLFFLEKPPETSSDFSGLMSLVVTLLTAALAAYGIAAYSFLKDRLHRELKDDLDCELKQQLEPAFNRMNALTARNALDQSIDEWERYETRLWYEAHHYDPAFESKQQFLVSLERAIECGRIALQYIQDITITESNEHTRLRFKVVNNLLYHYSTRRAPSDLDCAFQLVAELKKLINVVAALDLPSTISKNYEYQSIVDEPESLANEAFILNANAYETIAWTVMRFHQIGSLVDPDEVSEAKRVISSIIKSPVLAISERIQFREKYNKLFGLNIAEPVDVA